MAIYEVTVILREVAYTEAENKELAIKKVTEKGACWDTTVVKITAKKTKKGEIKCRQDIQQI